MAARPTMNLPRPNEGGTDESSRALPTSLIALWSWDVLADRFEGDDDLVALFGMPSGRPLDDFLRAIGPEDRVRVSKAVERALVENVRLECDFHILSPQLGSRWIAMRGVVHRDTNGGTTIQGVAVDVTHEKRRFVESEGLYRATFATAAVGIANVDLGGRFTELNEAFGRIVGYDARELVGVSFAQITHPDDVEADWALARKLLTGEIDSYTLEKRYLRRNGSFVWINLTASLVRDPAGEPKAFVAVVQDIHERKAAEEALSTTLESIGDGFFAVDGSWRFVYVNAAAESLLGIRREDVIGLSHWDVFPLTRGTRLEAEYRRAAAGEARDFHNYFEPWGRWFHNRCYPRRGGGMSVYFQDVTDVFKLERSLRESETRFRRFFESASVGAVQAEPGTGRVIEANARMSEITGYSKEELLGMTLYDFPHPEDVPSTREGISKLMSGEIQEFVKEKRYVRKDGRIAWVVSSVSMVRDEQGSPLETIVVVSDVSERKAAEEAVHESEERFRALADNIDQLAWMADENGWIFWYNRRWYEYTGTTPEQMEGWGWQRVHEPQHLPAVLDRWRETLSTGKPFDMEFPLRGADGAFRQFLTRVNPIRDENGSVVRWFGTNTDISALRDAERIAKERAEELNALIEAVPAFVFITHDVEGSRMFGSRMTYELLGLPPHGNLSLTAPEDERLDRFRAIRSGKAIPGNELPIQRAAKGERVEGETVELEFQDGRSIVIMGNASPLLDEAGRPRGAIGVFVDITASVRAEQALERKVRERTRALEEANREMEGFTYSVAHDLRAPLRAISGTSRILLDELGDELDHEHGRLLTRQVANATKLAKLIDDLLALSRIGRQEFVRSDVDVTALVDEVVASLQNAKCVFEVQREMTAHADAPLLRTAIQNLLDNACKYSPNGGTIRVGCRMQHWLPVFYVRDEGIGLEMQYAERIFKPFERLHRDEEYPGTGVGLASVQRAIERHGGRVWAESAGLGLGTTFYFTLG